MRRAASTESTHSSARESHGGSGLHKRGRHGDCSVRPTMANLHNGTSDQHPTQDPYVSSLDQDRAASMADEGGFSGALMDLDDTTERRRLMTKLHRQRRSATVRNAAAAIALLAVAGFVIGWLKRGA
jgi:hypothetical protein